MYRLNGVKLMQFVAHKTDPFQEVVMLQSTINTYSTNHHFASVFLVFNMQTCARDPL